MPRWSSGPGGPEAGQEKWDKELKDRRKEQGIIPYIDSFGYDLPQKVRLGGHAPKQERQERQDRQVRQDRQDLQLPKKAPEAPRLSPRFRESVPSAISPSMFGTTDLDELEVLTERMLPSKEEVENAELLQKQKQRLEELEQRLTAQDVSRNALLESQEKAAREERAARDRLDACLAQKLELEDQLEQERATSRNLAERRREIEDMLEAERISNQKLAAEKREVDTQMESVKQQNEAQRDELLSQKEKEIQAILREERLQSQELLAKQASRQSDNDKKLQAELDAVRTRLDQVMQQKVEEELRDKALIQKTQQKAKDYEARSGQLEGELRKLQAREEELQQVLRQREAQSANAERRAAQLEAQLRAKEPAADSAEELEEARKALGRMAEDKTRLQVQLEQMRAQAEQMQAESQRNQTELEQQLQANRRELDSSAAELRQLRQEKEGLRSRLESTQHKACELEVQQRQQDQQKEKLQEQLQAQGQELEDVQAALKQMANSRKHLNIELEEAHNQMTQLQTAQRCQGELEQRLEGTSRDVEEAKVALQKALEEKEQLQRELGEAQERAGRLQEDARCREEQVKELEEKRQELNEAKAALDAALAAKEQAQLQLEQAQGLLRGHEVGTAASVAKEAKQQAELVDVLAQKELLEAQLAATIVRLDEEQAERIRQGARAETLEKDLAAHQRNHSEQVLDSRCKLAEQSWLHLTASAAWHMQDVRNRQAMSELTQSRRLALQQGQQQQVEMVESLRMQQGQKQTQEDQLQRHQAEDMATCMKENEELRARNRELTLSMQHFKQENDQLHVDNRSLLESAALFEGDLEKVADRHAQLIGHVNKKQKIRYTVKLKEECAQLRLDLNKARHKLMQLEGSRRSDSLYGALTSLGYAPAAIESSPQPKPRTHDQSPCSPAVPPTRISPRRQLAGGTRAQLEEAQRRVRLQESALERVNSDFRHLVTLVQRVIGREPGDEAKETSFAELLQNLRRVMTAQAAGPSLHEASPGNGPSTPRARDGLASPLNLSRTSHASEAGPAKVEDSFHVEDKENQLNIHNQTEAELDGKRTETHEVVRKVIKQINFALSFGARKLYGRPIQDARSFFEALDRHGNGVLERKDIAQGFKRLDIVLPHNTLEMLVKMVDQDANGSMSLDELLKALDRTERIDAKTHEGIPPPRKRQ